MSAGATDPEVDELWSASRGGGADDEEEEVDELWSASRGGATNEQEEEVDELWSASRGGAATEEPEEPEEDELWSASRGGGNAEEPEEEVDELWGGGDGDDDEYELDELCADLSRVDSQSHAEGQRKKEEVQRPTTREDFSGEDAMYQLFQRMAGILVLNGMGSGLQYKSPERLKDPSTPEGGKVHRICSDMDRRFGQGSWMLVYGGDPLNEEKPDLAVMAHHIQGTYGCHVCAVQCDCVLGAGWGVDPWVNYVYYYPTDYFLQEDGSKNNYWAGVTKAGKVDCDSQGIPLDPQPPEGTPVGQTKVYLSNRVRYLLQQRNGKMQKGGVIAIGGGGGSADEIK